MFSIIVTACYTGSIIAFVTLFVYPPVIDTVDQLLEQDYRIGSLSMIIEGLIKNFDLNSRHWRLGTMV